MDIDQIVQIESQVLLWAFVAIVVFLALGFLRGLLRGWRYGTYRLIAFTILIVIAFATLPAQANAVGGLNIAQWVGPSLSTNVNGTPIDVTVTTVFGTINSFVSEVCKAFNVGSPDSIAALATALATSVIKLAMMVVDAIIVIILGSFLVLLLWHLAFKHIIPKKQRKASYKKGKIASAFEEVAIVGVLMAMFLTPFTSLINSVAHGFDGASGDDEASVVVDGPAYSTVKAALDTYDDSLLSKVFFGSYARNDENESFDEQLVNFFTSAPVANSAANAKISIGDLLGDVTKVASAILKGGLFDEENMNEVGFLTFAASRYLPELIYALADSDFFTALLPIGVEIVLSLPSVEAYVATNEGIDTSHVNWADGIGNLAQLVKDIQDAGIIDVFFDPENEEKPVGLSGEGIAALFDETHVAKFNKVLDDLDSNSWTFLNKLLQSALYVTACKSAQSLADAGPRSATSIDLSDFLPSVDTSDSDGDGNPGWDKDGDGLPDALPASYSSIRFGEEIKSVYNSIADLNGNLADEGVADFIPQIASRIAANTITTDNYVSDLLFDHPRVLESAIVGDVDPTTGELTNIDPVTGKSTGTTCLLDSTFLANAMPRLLKILSGAVSSTMDVTVDGLDEAIASLDTTLEFKGEFNAMFKIVNALVAPGEDGEGNPVDGGIGKTFIKHYGDLPGIDYDPDGKFNGIDDGLLVDLENAMKAIDDSVVLPKIMKGVFSSLLGKTFSSAMGEGWVDPIFPEEGLGQSLADLLRTFGDCGDLIRFVTNLSSSGSMTGKNLETLLAPLRDPSSGYANQFKELLRFMATSPILNPDVSQEGGGVVKNTNFLLVVNKALGAMGDDYLITQEYLSSLDFNAADEADAFVDCVVSLVSSGLVSTLSDYSGSSLDIAALQGVDFEELFSHVDDSFIMRKVFSQVLDKTVLPVVTSLSTADLSDVTFANVTSWATEGRALDALVRFASEIGDFSNIQYLDSDPTCVAQILYTLSQSQMFVKTNYASDGTTILSKEYLFPRFFQDKFIASFGTAGPSAYFCDIDESTGANPSEASAFTYSALLEEFEKVAYVGSGETGYDSYFSDGEYRYWTYDESTGEYSDPVFETSKWAEECDNFEEIVRRCEYIGGFDSFKAGSDISIINPTDYDALLGVVCDSKAFGKVLTYHLFQQALGALASAGSALTGANLLYLWTCGPEQREFETDCMSGLMYVILDDKYGLVGASGALSAGDIQIDTASPEYFLYPLLSQIAESSVFNSLPENAAIRNGNGLTACENQIEDLLEKAEFYLDGGGNPDTVAIERQINRIGHLSGALESQDGALLNEAKAAVSALVGEIGDGSSPLPAYEGNDRHAALEALGFSESAFAGQSVSDVMDELIAAADSANGQASLSVLLSKTGGEDYLLDEGARKAWVDESQALATVGKKLQDFISGVSGFQVSNFDVSGYFVNEFDEDVGGAYQRNAVSATDNDFAQGRIESLVGAINSSRLLYEALPAKIASALTIISTGVSGYSAALASGLSTLLDRVKSIGTIVSASRIALGDGGDPEDTYPYDGHREPSYPFYGHLTADQIAFNEISSLCDIFRTGSVFMKIPSEVAYLFAKAYEGGEFLGKINAWNDVHVYDAATDPALAAP